MVPNMNQLAQLAILPHLQHKFGGSTECADVTLVEANAFDKILYGLRADTFTKVHIHETSYNGSYNRAPNIITMTP